MTETVYWKVLEAQKKKVKDYEEVHFRKSIDADGSSSIVNRDLRFSSPGIVLNPKRLTRQSVAFSRDQAPLFFRCTEELWFYPNYSRMDASKHLLDFPTGSFIVRNSEKAHYAITIRLATNDPPVSHFLIQTSPQGFLTIQGSNLPFLSLYDLLSFFCFNQSGGMPCHLKPPDPSQTIALTDLSDTSDSNNDEDCTELACADNTVSRQLHNQSEPNLVDMLLDHCNNVPDPSTTYVTSKPFTSPPMKHKATPPPKSPHHNLSERILTDNQRANIVTTVRRVSGLVEVDVDDLFEGNVPRTKDSNVLNLIKKFDSNNGAASNTVKQQATIQNNSPTSTAAAKSLPKAKVIPPPPLPPRPILGQPHAPPILPPHTPAPRIPPKPPGSHAPNIVPRNSSVVTKKGTDQEVKPYSCPPIPPRPADMLRARTPPPLPSTDPETNEDEMQLSAEGRVLECSAEGRASECISVNNNQAVQESSGKTSVQRSKASAWTKKLHWPKKPQKRIKNYILDLASDQSDQFGVMVSKQIAEIQKLLSQAPAHSRSHQDIFSAIRKLMNDMRDILLSEHKSDLIHCGMEQCANFEHVMETALQHCVVKPLSPALYELMKTYLDSNKSTVSLQNGMEVSLLRTTEAMGIRKHLIVPSNKVVGQIGLLFTRMSKAYCAISKLEYLLEAVRLIYENVRDSRNPKKPVTDLGADDFLPIFVWVLAQCQFTKAEMEAEYMWGLAHPSLFKGEGGYYLTTLTSAINVLKANSLEEQNDQQTELKVFFEDQNTGQFSSAFYLQVVPLMTAAEICEVIADKHRITHPQNYALFAVTNGQAKRIEDKEQTHDIKMKLLQDQHSSKAQPGFIAYKRVVN